MIIVPIKILFRESEEGISKNYINLWILSYQLFKTIQILITALSTGIVKWAVTGQIQFKFIFASKKWKVVSRANFNVFVFLNLLTS